MTVCGLRIYVVEEFLKNFKNKNLLKEAFTHRSYLNETREKLNSNERLEFLGDAVLELLVSEHLFHRFPNFPEGRLTNLRSAIVRAESLARVARKLNLGEKLLMSKGEEEGGGRKNLSLLANCFEALLGALYLDQGINRVKEFLQATIFIYVPEIIKKKTYQDFKSYLQEKVQEKTKISPIYKVVKEIGPDHQKVFTVGVYVKEQKIGQGRGKSKQEAEQEAAKEGLEKREYNLL